MALAAVRGIRRQLSLLGVRGLDCRLVFLGCITLGRRSRVRPRIGLTLGARGAGLAIVNLRRGLDIALEVRDEVLLVDR